MPVITTRLDGSRTADALHVTAPTSTKSVLGAHVGRQHSVRTGVTSGNSEACVQQQAIAMQVKQNLPVRERVTALEDENARLLFRVCILASAPGEQHVWQSKGTETVPIKLLKGDEDSGVDSKLFLRVIFVTCLSPWWG
jgi:hypothetical protein